MTNRVLLSIICGLAIITCTVQSAGAALEYEIDGGLLTGIRNVVVGGSIYNVTFIDGKAEVLFPAISDFDFTTSAGAFDASSALLIDALIDGPAGNFDSEPGVIRGCVGALQCNIVTPYAFFDSDGFFIRVWVALNSSAEIEDAILETGEATSFDFADLVDAVYADWTFVTTVPIPGVLPLFAVSLAGIARFGRKSAVPSTRT